MTSTSQKEMEKIYAAKAADLLGEAWDISASDDEENWPDLIIRHHGKVFGVEVREVFLDEGRKGSKRKAGERSNMLALATIAGMYYRQAGSPIRVNTLGSLEDKEQILLALQDTPGSLQELEQTRVEIGSDCVAYVRRLPESFGKYTRWTHVTDRAGWVRDLEPAFLEEKIEEKSGKIEKYQRNVDEVRLLLVANRAYNSGKMTLTSNTRVDRQGFSEVYLLSYPDSVVRLCS